MKSVTDLEQSHRLAEILPKATADFIQSKNGGIANFPICNCNGTDESFPAWSLTALCNAIKITENTDFELNKGGYDVFNKHIYIKDEWFACYENTSFEDVDDYVFISKHSTEIIDAVVELIFELKEKNLL